MNDKVKIDTPIEIKDNSKERVAFDLMVKIAQAENKTAAAFSEPQRNRLYWLRLYNQCHRLVSWEGATPESVIKHSEAEINPD